MPFVDILFPLNLGPLTYRCPEALTQAAQPGMLVSAPLKKSLARGVLLRKTSSAPPGPLKEIAEVIGDGPLFSRPVMKLLSWMSEYYLAPSGLVLKQAVPNEMFVRVKARQIEETAAAEPYELVPLSAKDPLPCEAFMEETGYRTTLLHASSLLHEISATAALLRRARNALILFPEIIGADRFFASIRDMGDRACILHSDMAAGKRSAAIEGILSGRHDIVIGTRTALAAPVRKPELIIVMHEQSGTYKLEDGIRFNIRDCAIMRGFLEKIPVLLTSSAPSMESWANALTGKYHLRDMRSGMPPPKIRTVDMRFSKKVRPYLSASVTDAVRSSLRKEEKVVFVINRRGHSTMVHCEECGNTDRCAGCGIPLVLHKDGNTMQCHYCGSGTAVPEVCGKCGNPRLELLGAGTQKLEEDVRELFGAGTVRFDRDKTGRKSVVREILDRGDAGAARIVVATKIVSRLLGGTGRFGLAAFLNPDISLNIPDFRAREKAYQEIMAIRDLLKPSGEMLLQTRNPQDSLFRFLRDNDYASFAAEELLMRKTLGFPPYVKMMDVVISGNGNLPEKAVHLIRLSSGEIEILGPIEKKTKKGKTEHSILIRHPQRTVLHAAARSLRDRLGKTKGAEIRVDVDPY